MEEHVVRLPFGTNKQTHHDVTNARRDRVPPPSSSSSTTTTQQQRHHHQYYHQEATTTSTTNTSTSTSNNENEKLCRAQRDVAINSVGDAPAARL